MWRHRARTVSCGLACLAAVAGTAPVTPRADRQAAPPAARSPYLKLAEPWPDAGTLRKRQAEAEGRPLFSSADPLVLTLTADFKAIGKDRDPLSARRFLAQLAMAAPGGGVTSIQVRIGTRGQIRLNPRTCEFPPLRIEFVKSTVKRTVFEGQDALKLVTHCWPDASFEQYVLREYLAYQIFNVHTPRSFRARLATITYVDTSGGKTIAARRGILIEDEDDVARRMGGRVVDIPRALFSDLDRRATTVMSVLQYLIGNTDYSIYALHNVALVQTPALGRALIPVAYDFDISGLVNPHYGLPDPKLGIASVRDRMYRGPCPTLAELEPVLSEIRGRQAAVMALADAVPGLSPGSRKGVLSYLGDFYATIAQPDRVKRAFIDACAKITM
jgi:hypothetical protein